MRGWVAREGTKHPVLADLDDAYLERLAPGPVTYPAAFLLDRAGVVVWEGGTGRTAFAASLEAALERALPAPKGETVVK